MRELKFRIWSKAEGRMCKSATIKEYMEADAVKIPEGEERYIMQSTGLLDKNGKEIYEGDVIRYQDIFTMQTGVVKYNIESACYEPTVCAVDDGCWSALEGKEKEIIGNIYENPELLI